jgi:hypothetical protein
MPLVLNGTTGVQGNSGAFVQGTPVNAGASGVAVDFTGIPSWAKRITILFNAVSTNGTSAYLVQIGTSSGIESTGYAGQTFAAQSTAVSSAATTSGSGFVVINANDPAYIYTGTVTLTNYQNNSWIESGLIVNGTAVRSSMSSGAKVLGGTLDRVRITMANGTDIFDLGAFNILYE